MQRRLGASLALLATWVLVSVPVAAQSVDDILAANLAARGGRPAHDAVTSVRQTGVLDVAGGEATVVVHASRPDLVRQELTVGGQVIINAFDGREAWVLNPLQGVSQPTVVTGAQAAAIRRQAAFDGPLQAARAAGDRIELIGQTVRRGRAVYDLRISNPAGHQVRHAYVDVETRLEQAVVTETHAGWFAEEFSDYRTVHGLQVPFVIRTALDGRAQSEIRITEVAVNVGIDQAAFQRTSAAAPAR